MGDLVQHNTTRESTWVLMSGLMDVDRGHCPELTLAWDLPPVRLGLVMLPFHRCARGSWRR
jgi:hypothetical protein